MRCSCEYSISGLTQWQQRDVPCMCWRGVSPQPLYLFYIQQRMQRLWKQSKQCLCKGLP